jgi:Tfp pilus assembly protein FimT
MARYLLLRLRHADGEPESPNPRANKNEGVSIGSEMTDNAFYTNRRATNAAGFSVVDLLIVISIVGIVTSFAFTSTVRARKHIARANEIRKFAAHLEKCRLDSIRRRATTTAQFAQITIINASSYSVTMDFDGDGSIDSRVVSLPVASGLTFNAPFPRTIYFNWRGRTVDAAGNVTVPGSIKISNSDGANTIVITGAGQPSFDAPVSAAPVTDSWAPESVFRSQTTIP